MAIDVKKRKRELILQNVKRVPLAAKGEKLARILIILMFFLRGALLLFEIIFSSLTETKISVWSHLLFIPFMFIIYMIYDGNKPLVYIPMVSAPGRLIYHFTAVVPTIASESLTALTVISVIILGAQFFFCIFMSASTRCDVYFTAMQKVNIKLRSEMIGGQK